MRWPWQTTPDPEPAENVAAATLADMRALTDDLRTLAADLDRLTIKEPIADAGI